MATFQSMAAVMKNMKPEDIVAVIGMVQSGKLRLKENDESAAETDPQSQATQESILRQVQQQTASSSTTSRQVIDYSHGATSHQESAMSRQRSQQYNYDAGADVSRRSRIYGEPEQVGGGSRYDDRSLQDRAMLLELRQRAMSGQADSQTISMLAQIGGELRARDVSPATQGASGSMARAPWNARGASYAGDTPGYTSMGSQLISSQESSAVPRLQNADQIVQGQQQQNLAQHQALLQRLRQQQQSGNSGICGNIPSSSADISQMRLHSLQGSQVAQLQAGARMQSGVGQVGSGERLHHGSDTLPSSAVAQQLGATFQSDQMVLSGNGAIGQRLGDDDRISLLKAQQQAQMERQLLMQQRAQLLRRQQQQAQLQERQLLQQPQNQNEAMLQAQLQQQQQAQLLRQQQVQLEKQHLMQQQTQLRDQGQVQLQQEAQIHHQQVQNEAQLTELLVQQRKQQTQQQVPEQIQQQNEAQLTELLVQQRKQQTQQQVPEQIQQQNEAQLTELLVQQRKQQTQQQVPEQIQPQAQPERGLQEQQLHVAQLLAEQRQMQQVQMLNLQTEQQLLDAQSRPLYQLQMQERAQLLPAEFQEQPQTSIPGDMSQGSSSSSYEDDGSDASEDEEAWLEKQFELSWEGRTDETTLPYKRKRRLKRGKKNLGKRQRERIRKRQRSGHKAETVARPPLDSARKLEIDNELRRLGVISNTLTQSVTQTNEELRQLGVIRDRPQQSYKAPNTLTAPVDADRRDEELKRLGVIRKQSSEVVVPPGSKRRSDTGGEPTTKQRKIESIRPSDLKLGPVPEKEISAPQAVKPKVVQPNLSSLQERVEKGLDVKIQTMRNNKTPVEVINAVETNIELLMGRQIDVEKIKKTNMYQTYLKTIPRTLRGKVHPQTPDMYKRINQQLWDSQVQTWRTSLENFDPDDPHKVQPTTPSPSTSQTSTQVKEHKLMCSTCNFESNSVQKFEDHLASATHKSMVLKKTQPPDTNKDKLTDVGSKTAERLGFIVKKHKPSKFLCETCGYTANTYNTIQQHYKEHGVKIMCIVCKIPFQYDDYDNHRQTRKHNLRLQKMGRQPLKCKYCSMQMSVKSLDEHTRGKKHQTKAIVSSEKMHCAPCQITFDKNKKREYEAHLKCDSHRKNVEFISTTTYICKKCKAKCMNMPLHREKCKYEVPVRREERKYMCPHCGFQSYVAQEYEKHLTSDRHLQVKKEAEPKQNAEKKSPQIYKCQPCRFQSYYAQEYEKHLASDRHIMQLKKKEAKTYACKMCDFSSQDVKLYEKHLESATHRRIALKNVEGSQYKCTKCSASMSSFEDYEAHLLSAEHIKNIGGRYYCQTCRIDCQSFDLYKNHASNPDHHKKHMSSASHRHLQVKKEAEPKQNTEKKSPQIYKCQPCRFQSYYAQEYEKHLASDRHIMQLKKKEAKTHVCKMCDFRSQDVKLYEKHLESATHRRIALKNVEGSQYKCTKCSASMSSFEGYEAHLLSAEHIKNIGGGYYCQTCRIDCQSFDLYKNHVSNPDHHKKHMSSASHRCEQCIEEFPDRKSLDYHRKSDYHNLVTKIKRKEIILNQCSACNIKFDDLKILVEHIQDGEHLHIMKINGGVKCMLCSWLPSLMVPSVNRDYWKHLESKDHVTQLERLSDAFGSYQNVLQDNGELFCPDCKKTYKDKAKRHKCEAKAKNDPKQLCTIIVKESLSRSSCSEKVLKAYFRQFGEIVKILTVTHVQIRKTFITYKSVTSAYDVLEITRDHGGIRFQESELIVQQGLPSKLTAGNLPCTIFCMKFDPSLTRVDFFNHFSRYGKVKDIVLNNSDSKSQSGDLGYVIYESSKDMMAAYGRGLVADGKSTHSIKDKAVVCCTMVKNTEGKILIKEVPKELTHINLESYFSRYHYYSNLVLVRDVYSPQSTGYGAVKFCYRKGVDSVLKDGVNHYHTYKKLKFKCVPVKEDDKESTEKGTTKDQPSVLALEDVMAVEEWFEGDLEVEEDAQLDVEEDSKLKVPGLDEEEGVPGEEKIVSPIKEEKTVARKSKWDAVDEVMAVDEVDQLDDGDLWSVAVSSTSAQDVVKPPNRSKALDVAKVKYFLSGQNIRQITRHDLRDYFGDFAPIVRIDLPHGKEFGFIEFEMGSNAEEKERQGKLLQMHRIKDIMIECQLGKNQQFAPTKEAMPDARQRSTKISPPAMVSLKFNEGQSSIISEVVAPSGMSQSLMEDVVKVAESSPPAFKIPQLPPPGRAKGGSSLEAAVGKADDAYNAEDMKIAGIMDEKKASTTVKKESVKSSTMTYILEDLPKAATEGEVWRYFRGFRVGEVLSVFVARGTRTIPKKGQSQRLSWVRFAKIGPLQDKKLTETTHAIKGGQVRLVPKNQESSGKATPATATTAVDPKEVQTFADKIPEILQMNAGWKGSSRGIEYVAAGYRCNVCQWFYKAGQTKDPAIDRQNHRQSDRHAGQTLSFGETEYGVEGVYCKVCKEFVKSKDRQRALDAAIDHSALLKHHLHVKLHILQNNLRTPKWLQNPLYSKVKKKVFIEEKVKTRVFIEEVKKRVFTEEKAPDGNQPASTTVEQPASTTVEQPAIPGLSIVDYGSSDEEGEEEEVVEITEEVWKEAIEEAEDDYDGMMEWLGDQPPPPGEY